MVGRLSNVNRDPSVTGGTFWEEERPGVLRDILREMVQRPFEVADHLDLAFLQGGEDRHQNPPRACAGIRLRTKATLRAMAVGRRSRSARLFQAGIRRSAAQ
jgi:hypothetical protein